MLTPVNTTFSHTNLHIDVRMGRLGEMIRICKYQHANNRIVHELELRIRKIFAQYRE